MKFIERMQGLFGAEPGQEDPEASRIEGLKGRIKDLEKEREELLEPTIYHGLAVAPKADHAQARLEQINQEIENLDREIRGLPPLSYHGSQR